MRKFFVTYIFTTLCAVFSAECQTIAQFKEKLAVADTLSGAKVECAEFGSAKEAIEKFDAQTLPMDKLQGYRIRIYSGNHQMARAEAEAAKALFEENYAVPAYFVYDNPYFLVTVGNCLSQEEAMILLRSVRVHFPKAFIVATEIPRQVVLTRPAPKPTEDVLSTEQQQAEVPAQGEVMPDEQTPKESAQGVLTPKEPAQEEAMPDEQTPKEPEQDGKEGLAHDA